MMRAAIAALLMAAASASMAQADSCAAAENTVRASAAQGHVLMAQMTEIRNRHATVQWEMAMEQGALNDYGWDPETGDYIDELAASLLNLEQRWNALNAELMEVDPIVRAHLQTYETACGADADTPALLSELGLNAD